MPVSHFDEVKQTLANEGIAPALDRLAQALREQGRYNELFDAMVLKKRYEMGLPLLENRDLAGLPAAERRELEDFYAGCCREVADLYLADGNIPHAWVYLRAIGEPEKVAAALEEIDQESAPDSLDALIDIALHQGVNPRKGFELLLATYGTCNAVTAMEQQFPQTSAGVREECVRTLVRHLYGELAASLRADVARKGEEPDAESGIVDLIAGRDWLFEDNAYHIDTSHLGAVVRFSRVLTGGPELDQAVELAEYGRRLSPMFQYASDPPFERMYDDHLVYLKALAGRETDEAVKHFQKKLDNADETSKPYCAAVLVSLLDRLGRHEEALAVSVEHLAEHQDGAAGFPTVKELCRRAGDFGTLVDFSERRDDLVTFTAGLLEQRDSNSQSSS